VQGQLRRHAPDHPRPRHDHAPGAQLVQPLHMQTFMEYWVRHREAVMARRR
jgi:hypothetical protein